MKKFIAVINQMIILSSIIVDIIAIYHVIIILPWISQNLVVQSVVNAVLFFDIIITVLLIVVGSIIQCLFVKPYRVRWPNKRSSIFNIVTSIMGIIWVLLAVFCNSWYGKGTPEEDTVSSIFLFIMVSRIFRVYVEWSYSRSAKNETFDNSLTE